MFSIVQPHTRLTRATLVGVTVVSWLAVTTGTAQAAGGTNLLPNGTFEGSGSGSLAGWSTSNASAALAGDGAGGGYAAQVSASAAGSYKISPSTKPIKLAPVGEAFQATAMVRSDVPGKSVCLQVIESGAVASTTEQCVKTTADWAPLPSVNATVVGAADTLTLQVRQSNGVVGDSFEVDSLSIVDLDTTTPTVPDVRAAAVSSTGIDVTWGASSDSGPSGVKGYSVYRNGSSTAVATLAGTVFHDTNLNPQTTYSYTVVAFDYAKNTSADSTPATATTTARTSTGTNDTWHMDEASGGIMVDSTGSHNGTWSSVTPGVAGDPGFDGTAYHFNGSSSKVTIPNADDLNPMTADVHIAFSMRTSQVPATPDYDLFRKGTSPQQLFKLEFQPNGQVSCGFTGSLGGSTLKAGPALQDGRWHRIECVKTSTKVLLTIDGTTYSKSATIGSISNPANMIVASHGGSEFFPGDLDELSYRIG
ncbi:MAG: hypothetical protein ABIQ59_09625 [Nocardioidaceae bacterium]